MIELILGVLIFSQCMLILIFYIWMKSVESDMSYIMKCMANTLNTIYYLLDTVKLIQEKVNATPVQQICPYTGPTDQPQSDPVAAVSTGITKDHKVL